jgi:beta-glucanase (GH16 family)
MAVRNTKGISEAANIAYVGPHHFKFVFLDEYFDGVNDLDKSHVYIAKHGWEKKLCDTCTGWYKEVISEDWTIDDFFKGYISKAPIVKAEYGIRRENTQIDSNGITITIPASTKGNYKKTWGEVLFGPSFKYGHVTIHAKLAPMFGSKGLVNGIIHNLWLYERDPDPVDKSNPYHYLDNGKGKQPYEIDFEVWSSTMGVNTMWDDNAFIYYSIVDYMRNPKVKIKPGDVKDIGKYTVDRRLPRQAGIPGKNLPPEFFKSFHYFDLYWYPDHVRYLVDGEEVAVITKDMASIPDKYMFLWMGSPLYQDGTYYAQYSIPFLKEDKHTYIDYLRIE